MSTTLEDEIKRQLDESKTIYPDKTGAIIKGDNTQSTVNPEIREPVTDLREEEIKRLYDKEGTIEIDSQGFVKKGDTSSEVPVKPTRISTGCWTEIPSLDTSSEVPVKPTSGEPATHLKPKRGC